MESFALVVSTVSGLMTVGGAVAVFIRIGKQQGETAALISEMRKDTDKNAKDIDALGTKVNQIQLENSKMITALSSDLGWIKSSLATIDRKLEKRSQ